MTRMPLPLPVRAAGGPPVPCTECARCCTYVAIEINAPATARYATDILWYLYHENVSVFLDDDGEWTLQFETRCRNLRDDRLCAIYERRPHVCRDFDNTRCEVNAPGGRSFREPAEFLDYLKAKRPKVWRKIEKEYVGASRA